MNETAHESTGAAAERLARLADGYPTALGELLRDGVPGSVRGATLARGGLYYAALAGLLAAVRDGGTPLVRARPRGPPRPADDVGDLLTTSVGLLRRRRQLQRRQRVA